MREIPAVVRNSRGRAYRHPTPRLYELWREGRRRAARLASPEARTTGRSCAAEMIEQKKKNRKRTEKKTNEKRTEKKNNENLERARTRKRDKTIRKWKKKKN